jgi:hypothetical protein
LILGLTRWYSISITFVQEETELLWSRLTKWQNSSEHNFNVDTYLKICEQQGVEPDPEKFPPEMDDFPMDVQKAMLLFNKLGDRIFPDIGYLGKDYTQLPIYMDVYEVENRRIFLETLLRLDAKIIEQSAKALKAERDKIKAQSKRA